MKKRTVIVLIIAFLFTLGALPSLAQDEESNATESAASEESDEIREKVQQKIAEAQSNPKAYLGTVTDIIEKTIQVKSTEGEIQQVSINEEETSFVNITKTSKAVSFSDVALGDFIVAMGFLDGNSVLSARRILIAEEPEAVTRATVFGEVKEAKRNEIALEEIKSKTSLIITPGDTLTTTQEEGGESVKIRFSNIEEGSLIITVGESGDGEISARTIHVISTPEPTTSPQEE